VVARGIPSPLKSRDLAFFNLTVRIAGHGEAAHLAGPLGVAAAGLSAHSALHLGHALPVVATLEAIPKLGSAEGIVALQQTWDWPHVQLSWVCSHQLQQAAWSSTHHTCGCMCA
jgi:hypothetical protein